MCNSYNIVNTVHSKEVKSFSGLANSKWSSFNTLTEFMSLFVLFLWKVHVHIILIFYLLLFAVKISACPQFRRFLFLFFREIDQLYLSRNKIMRAKAVITCLLVLILLIKYFLDQVIYFSSARSWSSLACAVYLWASVTCCLLICVFLVFCNWWFLFLI